VKYIANHAQDVIQDRRDKVNNFFSAFSANFAGGSSSFLIDKTGRLIRLEASLI
jgi:hypothetical protein